MAATSAAAPSPRVRIGFVSTAAIATKNYHGVRAAANCTFAAVASRDLSKAQAWAAKHGCGADVATYGSYAELLADPSVDALYMPLPTALHLDVVLAAVAAGKPVLLEKPMALCAADLERMMAAAAAAGVFVWDGVMFVHHARMGMMRAVLASQPFGRVSAVVSGFSFFGGDEFLRTNIRVQKGLDDLGCVGDLGVYNCRFSLHAMNAGVADVRAWELPATATGTCHKASDSGVPLDASVLLTWADGRTSAWHNSFLAAFRQCVSVAGTGGVLDVEDFVITRSHASTDFTVILQPGLDSTHSNVVGEKSVTEVRGCNQEQKMWEAFAEEVLRVKAGGVPSAEHPHQALLTQYILDAIMTSIAAGGTPAPVRPPSL
jgi:predicted dehydrogenase